MIFIDSNIPMYLTGGPHPLKSQARVLLSDLVARRERLVTDAEVFQEILHRYVAIQRKDAIQPTVDVLEEIVDEIFAVDAEAVFRAKDLIFSYPKISARDALHIAVMKCHSISTILTFDQGFDSVPGIKRLGIQSSAL